MSWKTVLLLGGFLSLTSCVSIPKETVILSKTLGADLVILHTSHRNAVELQFARMENDINSFIDEVYAPAVIHDVLKSELDKARRGENSLYASIEGAGKIGDKVAVEEALTVMEQFLVAANENIETKRKRLLEPIRVQKSELLQAVDNSYNNLIYANSTVTGYLESIRKVKEAQNEALAKIGFQESQEILTSKLLEISRGVSKALEKGREIEVKSEESFQNVNEVISDIENVIKSNTDARK